LELSPFLGASLAKCIASPLLVWGYAILPHSKYYRSNHLTESLGWFQLVCHCDRNETQGRVGGSQAWRLVCCHPRYGMHRASCNLSSGVGLMRDCRSPHTRFLVLQLVGIEQWREKPSCVG